MKPSKLINIPLQEILDYLSTHSTVETAEYFDVKRDTLYSFLSRKGIAVRQNNQYKPDKAKLIEYAKTHTLAETARNFNVSTTYIRKRTGDYSWGFSHKKKTITPSNFLDKQREMTKYLAEKYSQLDIAIYLGVTPARVNQIIKKEPSILTDTSNPCIGCKHHIQQGLLEGGTEWTCAYSSCKYDFSNVNPKEIEYE